MAPKTIDSDKKQTLRFIEWIEEDKGVYRVGELKPAYVEDFILMFKNRESIGNNTIAGRLSTLRPFLRYGKIGVIHNERLVEPILEADVDWDKGGRAIEPERAQSIWSYLNKYGDAGAKHALFFLCWNTSLRLSGLRSLDCEDFDSEGKIDLKSRATTDTRLKNGGDSEREITLEDNVQQVIKRYKKVERNPVTDKHGRKPLFSTDEGRASKSTLRRWIYDITSCQIGHVDTSPRAGECDGTCIGSGEKCPISAAPHEIRRGSICYQLDNGMSLKQLGGRVDATPSVIRQYYDVRGEERKRKSREENVNESWQDWGSG